MPQYVITAGGTGTFIVPSGITLLTSVEVWGSGGDGGSQLGGSTGGGGGAYAKIENVSVTPGQECDWFVDAGGNGGSSFFDDGEAGGFVEARSGKNGESLAPGPGGDAGDSTGDVLFSGGNGASAGETDAGGGGAAASPAGEGANGSGTSGGVGVSGGGSGGDGGNLTPGSHGEGGDSPGGGGGGSVLPATEPGFGAAGKLIITYLTQKNSGIIGAGVGSMLD